MIELEGIEEKQTQITHLIDEVSKLYLERQYPQASQVATEALDLARGCLGKDHPLYAQCLNDLGELNRVKGEFSEAEQLLLEAINIRRQKLGEKHQDLAESMNNLGMLRADLGDYEAAESFLQQALDIFRSVLGEEHSNVVICRKNLGCVSKKSEIRRLNQEAVRLYKQERATEAITVAVKARDLARDYLGEESEEYGTCLNNLVELYSATNDLASNVSEQRRISAYYFNVIGGRHPDYVASANQLAVVLNRLAVEHYTKGEYSEAEPLMQEVLSICRVNKGEDHPDFATYQKNLGVLYHSWLAQLSQQVSELHQQKQYEQAKVFAIQAYGLAREHLGEENQDYLACLNNLVELNRILGCKDEEAQRLEQEAFEIRRATASVAVADIRTSSSDSAMLGE
jgi:tetratricopeptide (TPR) repeat protein